MASSSPVDAEARSEQSAVPHSIPFGAAVRTWVRIAALSFGGPAGQIAMMHRILVDEKRWIGEARFLHALNYCMLLPGPEAQQLAIYIGWLLHRTRGGLVAGIFFVLPGFVSILALSFIYVLFGQTPAVAGLLYGLKAAVLAIVLQAVVRIGSRSLRTPTMLAIAAAAFLAIFLFNIPFPLIVLSAGLIGWLAGRRGWSGIRAGGGHGAASQPLADADSALGETLPDHARPDPYWSLRIGLVLLLLWIAPTVALLATLGAANNFTRIALFFSKMAVVTFGGAYAVLAYVAQQAVGTYHWLQPGEMLNGLGMAETTPGPLIMVVQFVGFLAGYRDPGSLSPLWAATLAAVLTVWVTFVPCFLWIFLGAPFIERLRANRALAAALAAITAAVVGVILNLAMWFALHTLFRSRQQLVLAGSAIDLPVLGSLDVMALLLAAAAMIAVFRFKLGTLPLLGLATAAGLLLSLAGVIA
jgi:chromate transporter